MTRTPDRFTPDALRARAATNNLTGCCEWQGGRNADGYGLIQRSGRRVMAHREMWRAVFGEIPAGMYVCHGCDNPPCIELGHLFIGTPQQNARDCVEKRRHRYVTRRGNACNLSHAWRASRQPTEVVS